VKFGEFFEWCAGDSASVRAIPINELKFALRSPVIGVSILQPSGCRQILIPFESFCFGRFYGERARTLFETGIIFQDGNGPALHWQSRDQHVRWRIMIEFHSQIGVVNYDYLRESARRFKTYIPTALAKFWLVNPRGNYILQAPPYAWVTTFQ